MDPTATKAEEIFKMVTANAAKALRLKSVLIKEEYLADLAIIDLKSPNLNPKTNLLSHLVYSTSGNNVETLIVNGQVIMENKEVLTLNEEKIIRKVNRIAKKLA